jgi:hypothetical protein
VLGVENIGRVRWRLQNLPFTIFLPGSSCEWITLQVQQLTRACACTAASVSRPFLSFLRHHQGGRAGRSANCLLCSTSSGGLRTSSTVRVQCSSLAAAAFATAGPLSAVRRRPPVRGRDGSSSSTGHDDGARAAVHTCGAFWFWRAPFDGTRRNNSLLPPPLPAAFTCKQASDRALAVNQPTSLFLFLCLLLVFSSFRSFTFSP